MSTRRIPTLLLVLLALLLTLAIATAAFAAPPAPARRNPRLFISPIQILPALRREYASSPGVL